MVNSKTLIVSDTPIRVIFQNSVTNLVWDKYTENKYKEKFVILQEIGII